MFLKYTQVLYSSNFWYIKNFFCNTDSSKQVGIPRGPNYQKPLVFFLPPPQGHRIQSFNCTKFLLCKQLFLFLITTHFKTLNHFTKEKSSLTDTPSNYNHLILTCTQWTLKAIINYELCLLKHESNSQLIINVNSLHS